MLYLSADGFCCFAIMRHSRLPKTKKTWPCPKAIQLIVPYPLIMEYEYANNKKSNRYAVYRLGMAAMEADHLAQNLITEGIVDINVTSCW